MATTPRIDLPAPGSPVPARSRTPSTTPLAVVMGATLAVALIGGARGSLRWSLVGLAGAAWVLFASRRGRRVPLEVWVGAGCSVVVAVVAMAHVLAPSVPTRACVVDPVEAASPVVAVAWGHACGLGSAVPLAGGPGEVVRIGPRWYRYLDPVATGSATPHRPAWHLPVPLVLAGLAAVALAGVGSRRRRGAGRAFDDVAMLETIPAPPGSSSTPAHAPGVASGDDVAMVVRLYGPPSLCRPDGRAVDWEALRQADVRPRRTIEVLTYLVTHRRSSRAALVDAVWDGAASTSTLDNALWAVRRVCRSLGGYDETWVTVSAGRVEVADAVVSDVALVEAALARAGADPAGARAHLRAGLDWVSGPVHIGRERWRWFDLDGVETRARQAAMACGLALVECCLTDGDPDAALDALAVVDMIDPAATEVVLARLRALHLARRFDLLDEVVARYRRRCRHLCIDPDAAVEDLAVAPRGARRR